MDNVDSFVRLDALLDFLYVEIADAQKQETEALGSIRKADCDGQARAFRAVENFVKANNVEVAKRISELEKKVLEKALERNKDDQQATD